MNSRRGCPVPQHVTCRGAVADGLVEPANHGGQDVASLRIEVVARPVDDWSASRRCTVRPMLSADRDELCDPRELCYGVALVRLFERPGEECILADRLLGELGVDAARPKEQKPFDAVGHGAVEQVDLDPQVVGDEIGGPAGVGCDSAHSSGGLDHDLWPCLLEERRGGAGVAQIELGARCARSGSGTRGR